ncbi:MAG: hypothetical protein AAF086_07355 [Planctomycetota bacterium]
MILFVLLSGYPPSANAEPAREWLSPPERRAAFYHRQFVGVYNEHGQRDAAWDDQAHHFLSDFAQYWAYQDYDVYPTPADIPTREQLQVQRLQILETGCTDPIVNFILTLVDPERGNAWRQVDSDLSNALLEAAKNKNHPDGRGWSDARARISMCVYHVVLRQYLTRYRPNRKWVAGMRKNRADRAAALFTHEPHHPDDAPEFAEIFDWYVDDVDLRNTEYLLQAFDEAPEEKQWLAHVMRAKLYEETAWQARGGGFANTVAEDEMRKFKVYLQLAKDQLDIAWNMRQDRSYPARLMIRVAMGINDVSALSVWFDRALEADPYDSDAYRQMMWANRERWHGGFESLMKVTERAFDFGRYDTDIPERFEGGVAGLIRDHGYDWLRPGGGGGQGDRYWGMVQSYLERRSDQPTPKRSATWCWSRGFQLAYRTDRVEDAWEYFARLDENPDLLVTPYRYGVDRRWALGKFSAQREPDVWAVCEASEVRASRGELDLAIRDLFRARAQAKQSWTRRHLKDRIRLLFWEKTFQKDQWVDLLQHGLEGWRPVRGGFTEVEGGLQTTLGEDEESRLVCGLNIGTRYEAELTVRLPDEFYAYRWGGVGFNLASYIGSKPYNCTMVMAGRNKQGGLYIQDPDQPDQDDLRMGPFHKDQRVAIYMERWDQSLRVTINGRRMTERYELVTEDYSTTPLGLSAWKGGKQSKFVYESLRVRRLDRSPFELKPEEPEIL